MTGCKALLPWDEAPRRSPSSASRARCSSTSSQRSASMGVTRLSLGVENFDDEILEFNGRAHRRRRSTAPTAGPATLGFPQINIDLIAGMVGETEDNWQRLRRARRSSSSPDSVTIYQMELPYNTTISQGSD